MKPAALLLPLLAALARAGDVRFYPNIVCSGTTFVACLDGFNNFCCTAGSTGWFGIELVNSIENSGEIQAFSGAQCTGSETAARGANDCIGATFGQIAAGLVTGALRKRADADMMPAEMMPAAVQRRAADRVIMMEVNAVVYTNATGHQRTARIPAGHATAVTAAVDAGDMDMLDMLEDF